MFVVYMYKHIAEAQPIRTDGEAAVLPADTGGAASSGAGGDPPQPPDGPERVFEGYTIFTGMLLKVASLITSPLKSAPIQESLCSYSGESAIRRIYRLESSTARRGSTASRGRNSTCCGHSVLPLTAPSLADGRLEPRIRLPNSSVLVPSARGNWNPKSIDLSIGVA